MQMVVTLNTLQERGKEQALPAPLPPHLQGLLEHPAPHLAAQEPRASIDQRAPREMSLSPERVEKIEEAAVNQKPAMASWHCSQHLVAAVAYATLHWDPKNLSFP